MKTILLVLPNQLFENHQGLGHNPDSIVLIEDPLFFRDADYPMNFHKQKLVLHRASMKAYAKHLESLSYSVDYIEWNYKALESFAESYAGCTVIMAEAVDFEFDRRINKLSQRYNIKLKTIDSQLFINSQQENNAFFSTRKRWLMADFYKHQRKRFNILIEQDGSPEGGKWSYDELNRKKIPKKEISTVPAMSFPQESPLVQEAKRYVEKTFPNALGQVEPFLYPIDFTQSQIWLKHFIDERFKLFGPYEDALVPRKGWLYHSALTPMMNIGLLSPHDVIKAALDAYQQSDVPLASVEGFIRQILGWREFMRASYDKHSVQMRTENFWNHTNDIPSSFYDATVGIGPIDDVIKRVDETAYCHHIERLMVLGGFMFLCEIDPVKIYTWFMEMFIDSYDWVMVPNVFAMSQHADGGLITTKPYFSGSAYLKKMGYFETGDWCTVWDGLYWRFINKHANVLKKNPRWAMMCSMAAKMDTTKRENHLKAANDFLAQIGL